MEEETTVTIGQDDPVTTDTESDTEDEISPSDVTFVVPSTQRLGAPAVSLFARFPLAPPIPS